MRVEPLDLRRAAWVVLLCGVLLLSGCATPGARRRARTQLQTVLEEAVSLLGQREVRLGGKTWRSDCSGFVIAVYEGAGRTLIDPGVQGRSGTELLFRSLASRGRITGKNVRPGDLLFFHNTWDRNHNGLRDDRFSHVALAEDVAADGTVTFIHYASGRVKRGVLNLRHPSTARDPDSGAEWNSPLRRGRGRVLAGQLFFKAGRPGEG